MKKRIALFTIFCLLIGVVPTYATFSETNNETGRETYTLTMKEAVDLTLKNSPDLQVTDVYVDFAERSMIDVRDMRDDLRDGINATLQGAHQQIRALEMQKQAVENFEPDPITKAAKIAGLEVARQGVVYSMGAIDLMEETRKNIKNLSERAEEGFDDAKRARQDAEKKVAYGVEKLYLAMLILDDFIVLQEDNIDLQRELTRIERLKYQNGLSTAVEVDKVAQKVLEEEQRLQDLKNTRLLLTYQMNRNIGREWNAPLRLAPVGFQPVKISDVEKAYQNAVDSALVVFQLNRNLDNKRDDLRKAENNSAELERIRLEIRKAKIDLQEEQFKMKKNLEDLNSKIIMVKKNLTECKQKYEIAKADYEHVQVAYQQKMGLKVQVDGSKLLMDKAYNDYLKAVNDYYLAVREFQLGEKGVFFE
ncbi:MAG: TolC family protein [Clostridia bacterium]|nr:TolC family protein [Clostridia bacterium]